MSAACLPANREREPDGAVVPIRLDASARPSVLAHLLDLSANDRRLRFGRLAPPDVVAAYVAGIDFTRDAILGIRGAGAILAGVAHVAFEDEAAEVALSVLGGCRCRGLATSLFASAVRQVRMRGTTRLYMQFLAANAPIARIAQRFGMDLRERGSDAEAHLLLAPDARALPSADARRPAGNVVPLASRRTPEARETQETNPGSR